MKYKIFLTEEFKKDFNRCDKSIKERIEKEIDQLEENPYAGKPLSYKFLREKKVDNYRFYYLVYEKYVIVLIVGLSKKKDQQEKIDKIKNLLNEYEEEIKKKFIF
ncbi:hypothetical protein CMI38_06450 [Candidatus Pacearchaeota archaeon]|jgi:mRNA-degrading endonuclease RelE of RelBE toxin-antitoxin system|nr:hypothetical protein [Candidatus Pacearchaeota archaeon]|tara:strand:+ start:3658 stop:3972 length:315 start_codon:yes stop_codon:yes gene_type:complete